MTRETTAGNGYFVTFYSTDGFTCLCNFGFVVWAVVVAQLVEQSLPTPEICGSNPGIGKILSTNISTNCLIEKTRIKKKMLGMAHLLKKFDFV